MQIPESSDESKTETHSSQIFICKVYRHYLSLHNYAFYVNFPFNLLILKKGSMMSTGSLDDELPFVAIKIGYHIFKLQHQAEAI